MRIRIFFRAIVSSCFDFEVLLKFLKSATYKIQISKIRRSFCISSSVGCFLFMIPFRTAIKVRIGVERFLRFLIAGAALLEPGFISLEMIVKITWAMP